MMSYEKDVTGRQKIENLPFYHDNFTRNAAEVLLLHNGFEGSYLIRTDAHGSYVVSVRFKESVKHFPLTWDDEKKKYSFGLWYFSSVEHLVDHFNNFPVLSGESGPAVTLKVPYINDVAELQIYTRVGLHSTAGKDLHDEHGPSMQNFDFSIASKEGSLLKQGGFIKNWKRRWFVVYRNFIMYYKKCGDKSPKRILDLNDALSVERDETTGKSHCFRLVFPHRTFFICAANEQDLQDWITFLQWKLEHCREIQQHGPR